jgi:teichuronic acid exporter
VISLISDKLKQLRTNKFAQNLGWLGSAELVQRVARLGTTVTLARTFSTSDYGMVSAIYTIFDFSLAFTMTEGITAKVIQASDDELEQTCRTSFWVGCILFCSLAVLQCLLAYPISQFYDSKEIFLPICVLSLIFLVFPFYVVQEALIARKNRLEIRARAQSMQAIASNLIIICAALTGFKIWAIVLSMVLTYPIWIVVMHRNHPWRPSGGITLKGGRSILGFGLQLLGVNLLDRLRFNIDYLLIGRFLGLEALGLYFFAFNAGLGISQTVIWSLSAAWYPYFCEVRADLEKLRRRYLDSFKTIGLLLLPLVILQTSLSPFYVPIVFGKEWLPALPILILICLSALPTAIARANSQVLRAMDRPEVDLLWNLGFTSLFSLGILSILYFNHSGGFASIDPLLGLNPGMVLVAVMVLVSQLVCMPVFSLWMLKNVFPSRYGARHI